MIINQPRVECERCTRFAFWGKYSCKTCVRFYTDNFKLAKEHDRVYQRRLKKKILRDTSDNRLRDLYQRIKDKYFEGNYIPRTDKIAFHWKRGQNTTGGYCMKGKKLIKVGGKYKDVFNGTATADTRRYLIYLMIHEAVHLRLPHHKKTFRNKVAEIDGKVKLEDLQGLYEGLIKNGETL